ncbi:hypothetical protein CDAR_294481 [Caerostris darwini]|uniref:Uncharacterized protein n=1 Tax=Caerostris darwini TaxID=1538125 RepID=A0AAV4UK90_9ARAC|nr:hypothetical protein CDAR_294481 [Caerostris darwini]
MDEHYNEIYKDIFDVFMVFEHPSPRAGNPMTAGRNRHVYEMDEHYNEIYKDIFDVFISHDCRQKFTKWTNIIMKSIKIYSTYLCFLKPPRARNPMTAGRHRHVYKLDEHYNEIYKDIFDVFMFLNTLPPEPGIP